MNYEKVKVDSELWALPFFAYKISRTREQDLKYISPKKLLDVVEMNESSRLWNFTGEAGSERQISALLYMCGELGHYASIVKEDFMEDVVSHGFIDSLKSGKIEVVKHKDLGELVFLSDKVLERLERDI